MVRKTRLAAALKIAALTILVVCLSVALSSPVMASADFTIYKEGSTFYSKYRTGSIIYSGLNAQVVMQDTIDDPLCDELFIEDALYPLSDSVLVTGEVWVYGEGNNTIISDHGFYLLENGNTRKFSNMTLKNSNYGSVSGWGNADNVEIDNCVFENSAVYLWGGSDNALVNNSHFINSWISIKGNDATITNNGFLNVASNAPITIHCNNFIVSDNSFINSPTNALYLGAIHVLNPSLDGIIRDNNIRWTVSPSVRTNGIVISGEADNETYTENILVENNTIEGFNDADIYNGIYCHLFANPIFVNVINITIHGNYIYGFQGGIIASGDSLSITDNEVRLVYRGIWLFWTANSEIINNDVYGRDTATDHNGIILAYATYNLVHLNYIEKFDIGITEHMTVYINGDHNTITNNSIALCDTEALIVGENTVYQYNNEVEPEPEPEPQPSSPSHHSSSAGSGGGMAALIVILFLIIMARSSNNSKSKSTMPRF